MLSAVCSSDTKWPSDACSETMIQVIYTRAGRTYDYLRFRSLKGITRWMRWYAIPQQCTNIRIIC